MPKLPINLLDSASNLISEHSNSIANMEEEQRVLVKRVCLFFAAALVVGGGIVAFTQGRGRSRVNDSWSHVPSVPSVQSISSQVGSAVESAVDSVSISDLDDFSDILDAARKGKLITYSSGQ